MFSFIARRLFQSLLVMLAVALIAFAMFRYVGDPVTSMVGQDTPPNNAPNCPNSSA
jgi:peptide/nickel transport system permease protein